MKPKTPSESRTELTDIVLPAQTNYLGTIFGGEVMSYVDRVAAICAHRHARHEVVTASFDSLDFLAPIKIGHAIIIHGVVTWTGRSSMEIQVTIEGEDLKTGKRHVTGVSFLTFVAIDEDGKPVPIPPIQPETEEEQFQYERAQERAELRRKRRQGHLV